MNRHQPLTPPPPHNCASTSGFHNRSRGCSALVFRPLEQLCGELTSAPPSLPPPSHNFSF